MQLSGLKEEMFIMSWPLGRYYINGIFCEPLKYGEFMYCFLITVRLFLERALLFCVGDSCRDNFEKCK